MCAAHPPSGSTPGRSRPGSSDSPTRRSTSSSRPVRSRPRRPLRSPRFPNQRIDAGTSVVRRDLLIGDVFRTAVRAAPDRVAAWCGDDSITFAELDRRGNQVAHALRSLGVGHRDRVVAWNDTTLAVLPVFVALAKVGAVFAPMSPLLSREEA